MVTTISAKEITSGCSITNTYFVIMFSCSFKLQNNHSKHSNFSKFRVENKTLVNSGYGICKFIHGLQNSCIQGSSSRRITQELYLYHSSHGPCLPNH
jgi:hypothetical protein